MSKEEKIRKIIESWKGSNGLKEDTWQNVQRVLDFYGFTYERKREWVCRHEEFTKFAQNPLAKDLLMHVGLGINGEFSIAVTHGTNRKAGMVLRCYLKHILKAIDLLETIRREKERK